MRLTLGSRTFDLTTRALVLGVGSPDDVVDLVDEGGLDRALAAGAALVRLQQPTPALLERCAAAGVAVVLPSGAAGEAAAVGLPPDRVVVESLLLDVSAEPCPTAATAAGVLRGARIVRTADVRGARRVCDVLAAVLEAD